MDVVGECTSRVQQKRKWERGRKKEKKKMENGSERMKRGDRQKERSFIYVYTYIVILYTVMSPDSIKQLYKS